MVVYAIRNSIFKHTLTLRNKARLAVSFILMPVLYPSREAKINYSPEMEEYINTF